MELYIKNIAFELGFSACGITSADAVDEFNHLKDAINSGRQATMNWLSRNPEKRCDPKSLLPEARSVICCALSYGEFGFEGDKKTADLKKARFARGKDYHKLVMSHLEKLLAAIKEKFPNAKSKLCVDTSPILEKALAARAGLGWIGKHTLLINKDIGSWFALGEIITDIELEPNQPAENLCGKCTKCIDACPTKALIAPYALDASRCITYLTLEHKGEIPEEFKKFISSGAYGCDLCQLACPFNKSVVSR